MTKRKDKTKSARHIGRRLKHFLAATAAQKPTRIREPRRKSPSEEAHIGEVDRAAAASALLRRCIGLDGPKEIDATMKTTEPRDGPGGRFGQSRWTEKQLTESRAHG